MLILQAFNSALEGKPEQIARPGSGHEPLVDSAGRVVPISRFPLLAAYELCLKCSHLFNLLDARGAISVTERVGVIARIRNLAVGVANAYMKQQTESEMPPLGRVSSRAVRQ